LILGESQWTNHEEMLAKWFPSLKAKEEK